MDNRNILFKKIRLGKICGTLVVVGMRGVVVVDVVVVVVVVVVACENM